MTKFEIVMTILTSIIIILAFLPIAWWHYKHPRVKNIKYSHFAKKTPEGEKDVQKYIEESISYFVQTKNEGLVKHLDSLEGKKVYPNINTKITGLQNITILPLNFRNNTWKYIESLGYNPSDFYHLNIFSLFFWVIVKTNIGYWISIVYIKDIPKRINCLVFEQNMYKKISKKQHKRYIQIYNKLFFYKRK